MHRADIEPSDKNPPKIKFTNSLKLMDHTMLNDTLFMHLAETDVLNVALKIREITINNMKRIYLWRVLGI